MKENPFLVQYRLVIILLLAIMALLGISGCGITPPSEVLIPLVTCTPESPLVNVYKTTPQSWANGIFEVAFPAPPTPQNEQQILSARYAAFDQLVKETKRWSSTKTVKLDDANNAHITVTYISPELFQAVFLNQSLKDRSFTSGFQDHLKSALDTVAERNELLFLLTVTTINNNIASPQPSLKIPIQEMVLHNADNITIVHGHEDHNLEQPINASSGPVFGYLGYPFSLAKANECKWVLDPTYNTTIVITVPFLEVNGVKINTPYFWTIPYSPLMKRNQPQYTPNFNLPPGIDSTTMENLMTPLLSPPIDVNQANYWQDFARFVWNQITLGNY